MRFFNNGPILSSDDLTSTFRIQDEDPNVAYGMFWTANDGTGDSPEYGVLTELTRFRKFPTRPDIQLNRLPSPTDWTNPVELFKYFVEFYALLGQPQKAVSVGQVDYIGWAGYEQLAQTMLTTGITRTAQVSDAYRGGNYIGVWRTQFPNDFPITTIHTKEFHHMNQCSTISINGFRGAYSSLNGTHKVAAFPPSTISLSTPFPWQDCRSREHYLHILFDSSSIEEAYNPTTHGVATLVAHHGPITPTIGYRDFMATLLDFLVSSFGSGTHTGLDVWVNEDGITIPETFEQLTQEIQAGTVSLLGIGTRTYTANSFQLYWNPAVFSGLTVPAFNLNDPFGLGLAALIDPTFDYDITLENYLDPSTIKNIFFTVTGPELADEPITSMLVDQGYSSNGSEVVFKANDFATFPDPLVDKYGTHPWMIYGFAPSSTEIDAFSAYGYVGGIVKKELTDGKVVAYLRVADEVGFDYPFFTLARRSLVFGRKDITAKYLGNWIAAYAVLIEELNKYNPDRYIIDIRNNGGGFELSQAWGTLFGGNRVGVYNAALVAPGNGSSNPTVIQGSGIQTVFDSIPSDTPILQADEVAAVFPRGVVRSDNKKIELIILDASSSASSGDLFPHNFLGPDPLSTVHDLGKNVEARIIGDIDGRLYSSARFDDAPPINTLSPNLVDPTGLAVTALYMSTDAGRLFTDTNGYVVNPTPATQPNVLLPTWYDQTQWQDLGVTPIIECYPLGDLKPAPLFEDPSTWRDIELENAIKN